MIDEQHPWGQIARKSPPIMPHERKDSIESTQGSEEETESLQARVPLSPTKRKIQQLIDQETTFGEGRAPEEKSFHAGEFGEHQSIEISFFEKPVERAPWLDKTVITIIGSVLLWYAASISIMALNKWLFDKLKFTYPLLVTFIHFTVTSLVLQVLFSCRCNFGSSISQVTGANYFKYILPIALFAASEVALSNFAYSQVSLSLMTVMKSSAAVLTYLFSVYFGLERFSYKLLLVVLFIMTSISCAVPGLEIKSSLGVAGLGVAVSLGALRWVIVHHQLQNHQLTPLQLMLLTQPLSSLFIACPAIFYDVRVLVTEAVTSEVPELLAAVRLICCTVFLAFLVVFSEYNLVRITSSVTLTVAGIGKEIAVIFMSIFLFEERFGLVPSLGILSSIIGILIYAHIRHGENRVVPGDSFSEETDESTPKRAATYSPGRISTDASSVAS